MDRIAECMPGMDLTDLMNESGLNPTQRKVKTSKINEYAEVMRSGTWDWERTAKDLLSHMIKDNAGNILDGHHRFIAVELAGVQIPEGVVIEYPALGARVPRPWQDVVVIPGN